jgi:tetratricopeptide (TPR) repeat protein
VLLFFAAGMPVARAHDITPQATGAPLSINSEQKAANKRFLTSIDEHYSGNRKMAAEHISLRGWQSLHQGHIAEATQHFNQARLLDNENGNALWGMATAQASSGKLGESLSLFVEAERIKSDDPDFSADYAKTLGLAGVRSKNKALLQEAFVRFERLYQKAPQHTLNLQNWALTLFHVGNYAEAWKKLKLAETTPHRAQLDPSFVAVLKSKITQH